MNNKLTADQQLCAGLHGQAGATQHGGGEHVEHCDGIAADEHPSTTSTELFVNDGAEDKVLLDWLRERPEQRRCSVLLRQIMEWSGKCQQAEMSMSHLPMMSICP